MIEVRGVEGWAHFLVGLAAMRPVAARARRTEDFMVTDWAVVKERGRQRPEKATTKEGGLGKSPAFKHHHLPWCLLLLPGSRLSSAATSKTPSRPLRLAGSPLCGGGKTTPTIHPIQPVNLPWDRTRDGDGMTTASAAAAGWREAK